MDASATTIARAESQFVPKIDEKISYGFKSIKKYNPARSHRNSIIAGVLSHRSKVASRQSQRYSHDDEERCCPHFCSPASPSVWFVRIVARSVVMCFHEALCSILFCPELIDLHHVRRQYVLNVFALEIAI